MAVPPCFICLTARLESRERWGATWTTSVLFKKAVVITGQHETRWWFLTPWKINMENNHRGLVQIIFLSFHGWFVCSMLIIQGVNMFVFSLKIGEDGFPILTKFFSDGLHQTTNQEMSLARKHESRPKAFEALLGFFRGEVCSRFFVCCIWSHDSFSFKGGSYYCTWTPIILASFRRKSF